MYVNVAKILSLMRFFIQSSVTGKCVAFSKEDELYRSPQSIDKTSMRVGLIVRRRPPARRWINIPQFVLTNRLTIRRDIYVANHLLVCSLINWDFIQWSLVGERNKGGGGERVTDNRFIVINMHLIRVKYCWFRVAID